VYRRAVYLLSESEHQDIVNYVVAFPKAGDLIKGAGGVRKLLANGAKVTSIRKAVWNFDRAR
jgi:hypothetical protein